MTVRSSGARVDVRVTGDQHWEGNFQGVMGLSQLAVGYYNDLQRYPFHEPEAGGLNWAGQGRACNKLTGWFAVDKVTYFENVITAVDLRFEQFCDDKTTPARGQLHWTAAGIGSPPAPQSPPPAGLWTPDASFVPPIGNYMYLTGQGDLVNPSGTLLIPSHYISVAGLPGGMSINAGGWQGDFVGVKSLPQLRPGYYGNLQRYPGYDLIWGGMSWSRNPCSELAGWFTVDQVSYTGTELTSIDLRFEQRCVGETSVQRGLIHWVK